MGGCYERLEGITKNGITKIDWKKLFINCLTSNIPYRSRRHSKFKTADLLWRRFNERNYNNTFPFCILKSTYWYTINWMWKWKRRPTIQNKESYKQRRTVADLEKRTKYVRVILEIMEKELLIKLMQNIENKVKVTKNTMTWNTKNLRCYPNQKKPSKRILKNWNCIDQ